MKNRCYLFIAIILICFSSISNAEQIRYNGSSTILKAIMYNLSSVFEKETGITFDLKGKSTEFGLQKLLSGECDIAGGGRSLKSEEKDKGLNDVKICIDAYVFIVNSSNPIQEISSSQIFEILNGKLSSWDAIDSNIAKKIVVISPPLESAHYETAKKFIGFEKLPANSMIADMTPNVLDKVKLFPTAIGWISYANVKNKKDVKILNIIHNGERVMLNQANIQTIKYPYQMSMFFYTKGSPSGGTKKLIDFIFSDKGKSIIQQAGFFPVE
ncbi:MAG: substrate-binding domain-containing protein [Desulfobacterales bacterium]|nr:substrate-binding domain-containing protein [Desulfobacterales bacterium]